MELTPFGVLNEGHKGRLVDEGHTHPVPGWKGDQALYPSILTNWLEDTKDRIWPAWENGTWTGAAAATKEEAAEFELKTAVDLYHDKDGPKDILNQEPVLPNGVSSQNLTHRWHYQVEDARVFGLDEDVPVAENVNPLYIASRDIGSNFVIYDTSVDISQFDGLEGLFWRNLKCVSPAIFNIKNILQRPRPWTAAYLLGVEGFRWEVANGITHTGVHPSLLSGHCIQGVLAGCSFAEDVLKNGGSLGIVQKEALQRYMVDWGDRRVYAGVHYMSDNIGSWTLARRLVRNLFDFPDEIENLMVVAITEYSRVFQDILMHFPDDSPAKTMLLQDFPEAVPVG